MNILFVNDIKLRKIGNEFYSAESLSNEIMKRYLNDGDKIFLFTRLMDKNENKKNLARVDSEEVICCPSRIYHGPKDYFLKKRKIINELRKVIKDNKIDFCIIRLPSFTGQIAFYEIKKMNINYMVEMVGCAWDSMWYHGSMLGKICAPVFFLKTKRALKKAKNVIYVTQKFLQHRYPTKGYNTNISDVNILTNQEGTLEKRLNRIKNTDGKFKIGIVASLYNKIKGHYTALKSISILKEKYPDIELHLLGPGEKKNLEKEAINLGIKENVFFDGTLPNGEPVLKWLDEIDLFLLPSLQEGLPRCMIEAMSRGCPAVGTKTGGIPELIDNRFICKKKDYKSIAKKIDQLLSNKEEMIKQAKANFEKSKEYNKNDLNKKRKDFLKRII